MDHHYENVRIKWILRQREIFKGQLDALHGGSPNPFDRAVDHIIFADTPEARRDVAAWIIEIETMLGLDDAVRT